MKQQITIDIESILDSCMNDIFTTEIDYDKTVKKLHKYIKDNYIPKFNKAGLSKKYYEQIRN